MTATLPVAADSDPASVPQRRERIARIAATALEVPWQIFDARTPFVLYGMDSITAVEITTALEQEFGVELSASALFECPDVASLEAFLRHGAPRAASTLVRMLADAVLPDDVGGRLQETPVSPISGASRAASGSRHTSGSRCASGPPSVSGSPCTSIDAVLLTGATGFVGAHLLHRLLRETGARVHCLVRTPDENGLDRIRRNLAHHGIWEPAFSARVHVVEGDLCRPRLGLAAAAWESLASQIGAIYHGAACVNWVLPYDGLRDANVLGTVELLRLAFRAGAAPFHFLSSMAVCYSTTGPREVHEGDDMLSRLDGLDLGYAQSKCVAEELVREAGRRGLPVSIYRPSLVSGDSRSGVSNTDDIVSALIKGCIQMRCAPDLDWVMDSVPGDFLAEGIVRLSRQHDAAGRTFHLANPRARHWRECVLWMRLFGYPLRLAPYREWVRQLDAEGDHEEHALRHLRPFFFQRASSDGALTLPELYEVTRRSRVRCEATLARLTRARVHSPPLDADLLDRYFASFITRGFLPPPEPVAPARGTGLVAGSPIPSSSALTPLFEAMLRRRHPGRAVRMTRVTSTSMGGDDSIVAELTSWRSRRAVGLSRCRLEYEIGRGYERRLDVVVKVKPADQHVIAVGESVARLCDQAVGDAYARFRDRIGFAACHVRELAVYAQRDPRFRRHAPALLAARRDDARGDWVLVLEHLTDVTLLNAADEASRWRPEHVAAVLRGIADVHAIWYGRERELRSRSWIGHVQSAAGMVEMAPLWEALAAHARPIFATWVGREIGGVQERLLDEVGDWWRVLEAQRRTLIHNDFNPRNVALRHDPAAPGELRLCAYDWELATLGAPQHDLAEFLCFVLTPHATREQVETHLELHRRTLAQAAGTAIDAGSWRLGFRASLADLLVNRLALYALVHRVRKQRFLERVVRTWYMLHGMFPEGA